MSTIDDMMPEIQKLLTKVFEAGREDMKHELAVLLGHRLLKGHVHDMKRKPNGTVRPVIIDLLESSNGLRAAQITKTTGLKDNSVRTTLSILNKEGIAEQRDNLWFRTTCTKEPL